MLEGTCNRETIGTVRGGVTGAAVGVAVSDGQRVTILVSAVLSTLVGSQIGKSMDQAGRRCIGHATELAPDNQRVRWTGANGGTYTIIPGKGFTIRTTQRCPASTRLRLPLTRSHPPSASA